MLTQSKVFFMSKMIRIDTETHEKIVHLQSIFKATKLHIVQRAIDQLNKDLLLAQTDTAFKKLKRNKKAWQQECAERKVWETLNDDLEYE